MPIESFTSIPQSERGDSNVLYNYINKTITTNTLRKRQELKSSLDKFCTFFWRGVNAFDTFGAFIINKDNLKFYNGPSFSNEYSQPQFESAAGQLTGVKFKTQQISFDIGVYWISIEHYRQLIYWLHPYEINALAFGFDQNHYYQVKLAGISDSTRKIIGYETLKNYDLVARDQAELLALLIQDNIGKRVLYNEKIYQIVDAEGVPPVGIPSVGSIYPKITKLTKTTSEPRYYTEIKLTFEIQGTPCAFNYEPFLFNYQSLKRDSDGSSIFSFFVNPDDIDAEVGSDLEAPIQTSFALNLGMVADNFWVSSLSAYSLIGTYWHLIEDTNLDLFPTDGWSSGTAYFKTEQDGYTGYYSSISVRTIGVIKELLYDNTVVYVSTSGWVDRRYRNLFFADYDSDPTYNNFAQPGLVNFLIHNSDLQYYPDMQVNCALEVSMVADPELNSVALEPRTLFDVTLKNLTWGNPVEDQVNTIHIGYDSESGLLYMTSGDSEYFLLNSLSTSAKGQRIVESITVNSFMIPGNFNDPLFDIKNLRFTLKIAAITKNGTIVDELTFTGGPNVITGGTKVLPGFMTLDLDKSYLYLRGRTNLI